jgi:hypothetical protein
LLLEQFGHPALHGAIEASANGTSYANIAQVNKLRGHYIC